MKQLITVGDLSKVLGRFVIEINSDKDNFKLTNKDVDLEFYFAKRIKFISKDEFKDNGIIVTDLYGFSYFFSPDNFVNWFNHYYNDAANNRYHRLLYSEELDLVFDFIKKRNY